MSTCQEHSQVMSPCQDDAVSVAQALGTSGDVSFDESGTLALEIGATQAAITFDYEKESSDYHFEYLYIKAEDSNPVDIRPVPNSQSKQGFTVQLTGVPITANCKLYWRVVVPDSLHTCKAVAGGPQYILANTPQRGLTAIPFDTDFVDVTFPVEQPNDDWEFDGWSIEFDETVAAPGYITQAFAMTITERTTGGFRALFSGKTDHVGYYLRWKIS